MDSEIVNGKPRRAARMALSLGLLLIIVSLSFLERGLNHHWPGSTLHSRGYQILQAAGLLLLAGSTLLIVIGAIYGSLKFVLPIAAAAGIVSLVIAAGFFYWWYVSLEDGITLRSWTLALSVPGFVWTAAGAIFLLVAGLRFVRKKIGEQKERA